MAQEEQGLFQNENDDTQPQSTLRIRRKSVLPVDETVISEIGRHQSLEDLLGAASANSSGSSEDLSYSSSSIEVEQQQQQYHHKHKISSNNLNSNNNIKKDS